MVAFNHSKDVKANLSRCSTHHHESVRSHFRLFISVNKSVSFETIFLTVNKGSIILIGLVLLASILNLVTLGWFASCNTELKGMLGNWASLARSEVTIFFPGAANISCCEDS